jgi:hypothetical protein
MKIPFLSAAAGFAALVPALAFAQVSIQFGSRTEFSTGYPDWTTQIGADQIIQWNGRNSDGGAAGASGTLAGEGVGASLTSLGAENLVLTTTSISTTAAPAVGFPITGFFAFNLNSEPAAGLLGVKSGTSEDGAKFSVGESWTFSFNQDVVLEKMVGALQFNLLRFGIDIGNNATYDYEWNRSAGFTVGSGTVAPVAYGEGTSQSPSELYVATFTNGIAIPGGTEVTITSLNGDISLDSLVVTVIPEPSTYALLFGIGALGLIVYRRSRN